MLMFWPNNWKIVSTFPSFSFIFTYVNLGETWISSNFMGTNSWGESCWPILCHLVVGTEWQLPFGLTSASTYNSFDNLWVSSNVSIWIGNEEWKNRIKIIKEGIRWNKRKGENKILILGTKLCIVMTWAQIQNPFNGVSLVIWWESFKKNLKMYQKDKKWRLYWFGSIWTFELL